MSTVWNNDRTTRQSAYAAKLKDPRWKALRDSVVDRDHGHCTRCGSDTDLQVHHLYYQNGKEPWEYPESARVTLCEVCHLRESMYRRNNEDDLIDTLRARGYTFANIETLTNALAMLERTAARFNEFTPDEASRVIAFVLDNPSVMQEMIHRADAKSRPPYSPNPDEDDE